MNRMIFVAGEAGAGKTTLTRGALKAYPDELGYLQTHTTRLQREEWEPEYVFVNREEYAQAREASDSWDHDEIYGEFYGCDMAAAKNEMEQRKTLMIATRPVAETILRMVQQYEADPTVIYIESWQLERRARLLARQAIGELLRLEADEKHPRQDFMKIADIVFRPTGTIENDVKVFNTIIRRTLDE